MRNGEINYYSNPSKGIVVAVLDNVYTEITNEIETFFNKFMRQESILDCDLSIFEIKRQIPSRIIGKAKCSSDDIFSLETGKDIARARLLYKVNEVKERIFRQIYEDFSFFADLLNDMETKYGKKADSYYEESLWS